MTPFEDAARQIVAIGRDFHSRGWVPATSGNFSAVTSRDPLRLAITVSGIDKGALTSAHIVEIDGSLAVVVGGSARSAAPPEAGDLGSRHGSSKPSAESRLHVFLARDLGAQAVLHTHSVWSVLVSRARREQGGVAWEGLEMLKALEGVTTHEHREWLPILENTQDMDLLAGRAAEALEETPGIHGFLVAEHGLYTWGASLAQAKRHAEAFEFLLEVDGRSRALRL